MPRPLPLSYHTLKKTKPLRGREGHVQRLASYTYVKYFPEEDCWKTGYFNSWKPGADGRYVKVPPKDQDFHPSSHGITFHPDHIRAKGDHKLLNFDVRSQASKPTCKSTIYQRWGTHEVVQGEGDLIIDHDLVGNATCYRTEEPALVKVWNKDKYNAEKAKRVRAERALRVMVKMGVLGEADEKSRFHYIGHGELDAVNYGELLESLADLDGTTDNAHLEKVHDLIRKATYKNWRSTRTPEEAFEYLRGKFRDHVYQQKQIYTWEPTDDGRNRVDL